MTEVVDVLIAGLREIIMDGAGQLAEDALAEITRIRTENAALRADNALLAGAVRVWEPIDGAPRDGRTVITLRNVEDVNTDWFDEDPWASMPGWLPRTTHYQLFPEPPDPTRDAEIAAAVRRAIGEPGAET